MNWTTTTLLLMLITPALPAQDARAKSKRQDYPPALEGAKVEVYKTVGDARLNLYLYTPEGHRASDKRPAVVFFFGGGWQAGSPRQFEQHCRYFASRGMVAMTADYRVSSRHQTKAIACVKDAKSAIRWVRTNAKRLGVDPHRIAAGGGSAGGHLAACTGVIPGLEEAGEDTTVSSVPDALVLFNPALVLAPIKNLAPPPGSRSLEGLEGRMGIDPEKLSPYHSVRKAAPPTIIFHGKADTTVPYWTVDAFAKAMNEAGNRCELAGFEGQQHGFFNFGRGDGKHFAETVRQADRFFTALGFLKGPPTIDEFTKGLK